MSPDGLTARKTAYGLVDDSLKNRCRQIFLCSAFVNQGLYICFGKHAAACRDGIKRFVVFCIFVQTAGIRLNQRRHLVDKRTGTACADTVHTLLDITALKINDFGILSAKLDCHVRFRRKLGECGGNRDNLLHKRYAQMICKRKSARACNHRMQFDISKSCIGILQEGGECLAYICIVSLIIGEQQLMLRV